MAGFSKSHQKLKSYQVENSDVKEEAWVVQAFHCSVTSPDVFVWSACTNQFLEVNVGSKQKQAEEY